MTIYQLIHVTLNLSITFCLHSSVCLVHILISSLVLPQSLRKILLRCFCVLQVLHTFLHGDFILRWTFLQYHYFAVCLTVSDLFITTHTHTTPICVTNQRSNCISNISGLETSTICSGPVKCTDFVTPSTLTKCPVPTIAELTLKFVS